MDSDTIERYDRQIRLWGQHGQNKCSSSKICLVNADSAGYEVLRGLCLAGIGSFTILDSNKLTPEDIGCSFISHRAVGQNRGEAAKAMLSSINDDVHCEHYPIETYLPHVPIPSELDDDALCPLSEISHSNQDALFWKQFSCIIASGTFYTSQINRLSKICWANGIPFIQCKSIGFYGCMKIQLREHVVSDTHAEWRPASQDQSKPETALISTRAIYDEYENASDDSKCEEYDDEFITGYICLKALDLFFSVYGRLPGYSDDQVETDISKLKDCVKRMVGRLSTQLKMLDQCLYEISRYGGAELHVVSAFIGACVAQEVIKVLTNQYLPVDETLVYNAMTATTRAFKFNDVFKR